MDVRRTILVGAALVLIALLAACATDTQDRAPAEGGVLQDTEWVLVSLNGNAPIEDTEITLKFEEASIGGSAGCNMYGGSYTASEDGLRLSGVYATEMGCLEPNGILDQETAYLQTLNAVARYRVDGDRLELHDEAGAHTLGFVAAGGPISARAIPPTEPSSPAATASAVAPATRVPSTPIPPTATPAPEPPAATAVTREPPASLKRYLDAASRVTLLLPQSWSIVEPGPQGGAVILQSYPENKYVGGEAFQPGDSKCDLTIHPPGVSVAGLVQQTRSNRSITIVSEQEIILQSGQTATRMEIDSMGRSLALFAEVNDRAVVLSCYGELEPFDEIAATLGASE